MSLVVTTPLTVSDEAKEAQQLLKNNRFDDFLEGPADRTWGPECRRATLRAKKALGYGPVAARNPTFGSGLEAYLKGRELTAKMKARRADYLADQRNDVRKRALALLRGELGLEERPAGSNDCKFTRWYMSNDAPTGWTASRPGPAWCMIAITWAYDKAFEEADLKGFPRRGSRYAFCPFVVSDAIEGNFGLDQVRDPMPGDLVFYQFDTDSNADHVGIFEKWLDKGSTFQAIEGNTSSSSDANGGRVERRTRSVSLVYKPRVGGRAWVRVSPID